MFVSLKTFSAAGGIEKYNRSFAKALHENAGQRNWKVKLISMHDYACDEDYFPAASFTGMKGNKFSTVWRAVMAARKADVVILGHINLSLVVLLAKAMGSKARFILIAHGVEVWRNLSKVQQQALGKVDAIWPVSHFTASVLAEKHQQPVQRMQVLPNTLDPFFAEEHLSSSNLLQRRYRLMHQGPFMLTVARLTHTEAAKGYDQVLAALPYLIHDFPGLCYVLAGKWDQQEYDRLQALIRSLQVEGHVAFTGFVPDADLAALYRACPVFVMPSTKEGFGIVYLEAAWSGARVIASRAGGAPEAMGDGAWGTLVEPGNQAQLIDALKDALKNPLDSYARDGQKKLVEDRFGFRNFTRQQAILLAPYL